MSTVIKKKCRFNSKEQVYSFHWAANQRDKMCYHWSRKGQIMSPLMVAWMGKNGRYGSSDFKPIGKGWLNEFRTLRGSKSLFMCLPGSIDYISNRRKSRRCAAEARCTPPVHLGIRRIVSTQLTHQSAFSASRPHAALQRGDVLLIIKAVAGGTGRLNFL